MLGNHREVVVTRFFRSVRVSAVTHGGKRGSDSSCLLRRDRVLAAVCTPGKCPQVGEHSRWELNVEQDDQDRPWELELS